MRTAALLVLAVVLAGCSLVPPGPPGPPRSGSAAPAGGTTPAPTPTPASSAEYPPGVGPGGVSDADALLAAHRRSLVGSGFVVVTETTHRSTRGGSNRTTRRRVVAAPGLRAHAVTETRRFDGGRRVVHRRWTNGTAAVRQVRENGTVAGHAPYHGEADAAALVGTARLRWFLRRGDFSVAAVTFEPGGARYLLTAGEYVPGDGDRIDVGIGDATGAGDRIDADEVQYSARLTVTDGGRVAAFQASVAAAAGRTPDGAGRVDVVVYEYRLVDAGAPVERPAWVDPALAAVEE